jgi:hypothetical protein
MGHQPLRVLAVTRKPQSASFERRVLDYVAPLAELGIEVRTQVIPHRYFPQRRFLGELWASCTIMT